MFQQINLFTHTAIIFAESEKSQLCLPCFPDDKWCSAKCRKIIIPEPYFSNMLSSFLSDLVKVVLSECVFPCLCAFQCNTEQVFMTPVQPIRRMHDTPVNPRWPAGFNFVCEGSCGPTTEAIRTLQTVDIKLERWFLKGPKRVFTS